MTTKFFATVGQTNIDGWRDEDKVIKGFFDTMDEAKEVAINDMKVNWIFATDEYTIYTRTIDEEKFEVIDEFVGKFEYVKE